MNENEISKIIVEKSLKIHKALGPGLLESVYHGALVYELKKAGLEVESEKDIPVEYKEAAQMSHNGHEGHEEKFLNKVVFMTHKSKIF